MLKKSQLLEENMQNYKIIQDKYREREPFQDISVNLLILVMIMKDCGKIGKHSRFNMVIRKVTRNICVLKDQQRLNLLCCLLIYKKLKKILERDYNDKCILNHYSSLRLIFPFIEIIGWFYFLDPIVVHSASLSILFNYLKTC